MRGSVYEQIAREKLDMPGADLISIKSLRMEWGDGIDATRIEVGYVPLYQKGPNVGKKNYGKATECKKLYVTEAEAEAWLAEHPDYCRECGNTGRIWLGWSKDEGHKDEPCVGCNGEARPVPFPDADVMPAADPNQGSLFVGAES